MAANAGNEKRQSSTPIDHATPAVAGSRIPRSVNLHLWAKCNLRCLFCYQTELGFLASLGPADPAPLDLNGWLRVQAALAEAGVERLTYAGGEPTLFPGLDDLLFDWHIRRGGRRPHGMLVTNGAALYGTRLERIGHTLAAVKLSAESVDEAVGQSLGRGFGHHIERTIAASNRLHRQGIRVDLNSVVCRPNQGEDLTTLVEVVDPVYWKVFQFLPVPGQNDATVELLRITADEFLAFLRRHNHLSDRLVAEDNDSMRGSYAMVDPLGRFFQSTPAGYVRSEHTILQVGVARALAEVPLDWDSYDRRGGDLRAFAPRRIA